MSSAITVVGIGAAASAYSASQQSKAAKEASNKKATQYNAYGEEAATGNTGAVASKNSVFGTLNSSGFQNKVNSNTNEYTSALDNAANGQDLANISAYGNDVLSGKYLNSPTVNNYARQANNQVMSANANQNARTRAMYNRNGMGFSTGMQQAQQADTAAASAKGAGLESQIVANNYQNERNNQQNASSIIEGAQNQKLSYLNQKNSALYSPLQQQSSITTQLLGNGSSQSPTYVQSPTISDTINDGLSTATGLYSMYKGINSGTKANTKANTKAGSSAGTISYWDGTDASGNDVWK